jgi:hypothetical protein
LYVADAITVRDEAVVAATRDRSHYREYLGRIITVDEAATQRSHYDSSLEEVVKHRRREDVASFREQNCPRRERCAAGRNRMCSDDAVGPSDHTGGQ